MKAVLPPSICQLHVCPSNSQIIGKKNVFPKRLSGIFSPQNVVLYLFIFSSFPAGLKLLDEL